MRAAMAAAALAAVLAAAQPALAQEDVDTRPTLGIELTSFTPYHYAGGDGRTVVVGEVRNLKEFPVTGVTVWAGFFGPGGQAPFGSATGGTLLDVIPPGGRSPYVLASPAGTEGAGDVSVSVSLLGFNSAAPKPQDLALEVGRMSVSGNLTYSGTVTNSGGAPAEDVRVHMVTHDAFDPPRLLGAATAEAGAVAPGGSAEFSFDVRLPAAASGLRLVAESDSSLSGELAAPIPRGALAGYAAGIADVAVGEAAAGSPVGISASLEAAGGPAGGYVFYAQVRQSGEAGVVEHVASVAGELAPGGAASPSVEWVPSAAGLYFVETFAWGPGGAPIAPPGPVTLVLVR